MADTKAPGFPVARRAYSSALPSRHLEKEFPKGVVTAMKAPITNPTRGSPATSSRPVRPNALAPQTNARWVMNSPTSVKPAWNSIPHHMSCAT